MTTTIPKEIIQLDLPDISGVIVMAGAAMELHGLREADDIDLLVSLENWHYLLDHHGWKPPLDTKGEMHLRSPDERFDVWADWLDVTSAEHRLIVDDLKPAATVHEKGFSVSSPEYLVAFKAYLGRPKDWADIELIVSWQSR